MRCIFFAVMISLSFGALNAQGYFPNPNDNDFYYEECFEPSIPIPDEVVAEIIKTEEGKSGFDSLSPDKRQHLGSYFSARVISLGTKGERDLIVMGKGPMTGADNSWFWIVRQGPQSPNVVLWAGANSIIVLKTKTHGLRNIESDWCSAAFCESKRYKYNGTKYIVVWSKSEQQKPHK